MSPTATAEIYQPLEDEWRYAEPSPENQEAESGEPMLREDEDSSAPEEVALDAIATEEEALAEYGEGDGEWNDYAGPMQLDGADHGLRFDGTNLWQGGEKIAEDWTIPLTEKWSAGLAYSHSWREIRGDEEFLCVGIGMLGQDGVPVWTTKETRIPEGSEETEPPVEPEEVAPTVGQNLQGFAESAEIEDLVTEEEPVAFEAKAFAHEDAENAGETQEQENAEIFEALFSHKEQTIIPAAAFRPILMARTPTEHSVQPVTIARRVGQEFSHAAEIAAIDRKHFGPLTPEVKKVENEEPGDALPVESRHGISTENAKRPETAEKPPAAAEEMKKPDIRASAEPPEKLIPVAANLPEVINEKITAGLVRIFSEPLVGEHMRERTPARPISDQPSAEPTRSKAQQPDSEPVEPSALEAKVTISTAEKSGPVRPEKTSETKIPPETANIKGVEEPIAPAKPATSAPEEWQVIATPETAAILRALGIPYAITTERRERSPSQPVQSVENFQRAVGNPAAVGDDQEVEPRPSAANDNASNTRDTSPSLNGITLRNVTSRRAA